MVIGRKFTFEAAHYLPNREIYGKCSCLHGHRYELYIELKGNPNSDGWIINFSDLKKVVQNNVLNQLDHANLNDYIEIPTVENLAIYIKEQLQEDFNKMNISLSGIKLYETENSYVYLTL